MEHRQPASCNRYSTATLSAKVSTVRPSQLKTADVPFASFETAVCRRRGWRTKWNNGGQTGQKNQLVARESAKEGMSETMLCKYRGCKYSSQTAVSFCRTLDPNHRLITLPVSPLVGFCRTLSQTHRLTLPVRPLVSFSRTLNQNQNITCQTSGQFLPYFKRKPPTYITRPDTGQFCRTSNPNHRLTSPVSPCPKQESSIREHRSYARAQKRAILTTGRARVHVRKACTIPVESSARFSEMTKMFSACAFTFYLPPFFFLSHIKHLINYVVQIT